jgi:transposase IS116/IS110/IS902 family protein
MTIIPSDPAVQRLTRDLARAARTLSDIEARFLVDAYYIMQDARVRSDGQIRSIEKNPVETTNPSTGESVRAVEPHDVLTWFSQQNSTLEGQVKRALEQYVSAHTVGEWLMGVYGIGPVISAGLLAHIDIRKAPTVGHIWRYAGLDPTVKWEKKKKRPWNAQLKVLTWKAGESFVMFHNKPKCFYGHVWKSQKEVYSQRNNAGQYAERSAQILASRNYDKDTDAYKAYSIGKFPPAHIHAMARRYAVKLFLSHLHEEMYRRILGMEPPLPYPIVHLGHAHKIDPPESQQD